jgi:hypothetical protein
MTDFLSKKDSSILRQTLRLQRDLEREEDEGWSIWSLYFLYKYEYGTLKTAEVILRRGSWRMDNN